MASGESESTRVRLLAKCINQTNINQIAATQPPPPCCVTVTLPPVQTPTTPTSLAHLLTTVSCASGDGNGNTEGRCTMYYNPFATYGCQPVYTPTEPYLEEPGTEPAQGPAVTTVYRCFGRIRGIDQICKPFVGRSSSDRTARFKAGLISASLTRYDQVVLPVVPYPPCPLPPSRAGIPIPAKPPCNLGNRRVDYSNPRAN
jgi:hypothetical protein